MLLRRRDDGVGTLAEDAHDLFDHGCTFYDNGDVAGAIEAWRGVIETDPGVADAHYNLGVAYYDTGNTDAALVAFYCATSLKPTYASAHEWIGYILYIRASQNHSRSDWRRALDAYRRAVRSGTNEAPLHYTIGTIERFLGDRRSAIKSMLSAIELDSKHEDAYVALIGMCMQTGRWRQGWQTASALASLPDFDESKYEVDYRKVFVRLTPIVLVIAGLVLLMRSVSHKRTGATDGRPRHLR